MSKVKTVSAQSLNDFHKSNGGDFGTPNFEPSLTRQEFAEECDINSLMARYNGHVIGGPGNLQREPVFFDFADLPQDLLGYLTFMQEVEGQFMSLPAQVRREFDNNAVQFVEFASDPENIGQMREWGLAPPAKAPEVTVAAASASPAPAPAGGSAAPAGASTHGST